MAQDNIIGIAMDLDVSDLKAGLQETKKEITTANKLFANETAGMDDWTKNADGLKSKLKQLDTVLINQQKNVRGYEAELEKAKRQYGENSEEVRRLNDRLLDAQTAVKKTEKQQRKYRETLEQVEASTSDVTTDTRSMSRALDTAENSTKGLKDGFTVLKGAMANLVSSGIKSVVSGISNMVDESREFRKEMAYLEATANDTGSSFTDVEDKLREVASITDDTGAGVEGLNNLMTAGFKDDALDDITDALLGASIKWKDTLKFEGMADGLQETLATGVGAGSFIELLERSGIVADDFNTGLAECTTTAEKQQYIMDVLAKTGLADVKKAYVENNKSLVEGAKANFDYEKAMSEVGEKAEPVTNAIKKGWADVLTAILDTSDGMDTADISGKISDAFKWFIDTCVPFIQKAVTFIIDHFKAIAVVVGLVGGAFATWKVGTALKEAVDGTKKLIAVMKTLNLTAIKSKASMVAHKVATIASTTASKAMAVAQKALNLVMSANPIGLVVTALGLLVVAFITLWNKSEAFREFWVGLWEAIKKAVEPVIDWLVKAFTNTWDSIKKVWSVVVEFFKGIWTGIKNAFSSVSTWFTDKFTSAWKGIKNVWSAVIDYFKGVRDGINNAFSSITSWFTTKFTSAWDGIKNAWNSVTSWFSDIWTGIKNIFANVSAFFGDVFRNAWSNVTSAFGNVSSWFKSNVVDKITGVFTGLPSQMMDIGRNMIEGLIDGIKSVAGKVKDAVSDTVMAPVNWVKDKLGIHSPSRLMRDEIGKMMGEGVGVGLIDSMKSVLRDADEFAKTITFTLSDKIGNISAGLNASMNRAELSASRGTIVNNNYSQVINAPKQPSRIELYRQTKNLLSYKGVY